MLHHFLSGVDILSSQFDSPWQHPSDLSYGCVFYLLFTLKKHNSPYLWQTCSVSSTWANSNFLNVQHFPSRDCWALPPLRQNPGPKAMAITLTSVSAGSFIVVWQQHEPQSLLTFDSLPLWTNLIMVLILYGYVFITDCLYLLDMLRSCKLFIFYISLNIR